MDLVAGDAREILLAIGVEDWAGLRDPGRFDAYISFGGAMDPTWLDLFSQAARETASTGLGPAGSPAPFGENAYPLDDPVAVLSERIVERVDAGWVEAVARLSVAHVDAIATRWIQLIDTEVAPVDDDDKPTLRELAGELVEFCRRAEGARDVLFVWSL